MSEFNASIETFCQKPRSRKELALFMEVSPRFITELLRSNGLRPMLESEAPEVLTSNVILSPKALKIVFNQYYGLQL